MSDATLLCGDCAEVMASLDACSVDMVLTSPPYGTMRQYNGFSIDIDAVIDGIWHVLRDGGVCVWVVADQMVKGSESATSFRTALKFINRGFLLHDTMIYHKANGVPNAPNDSVRYHQSFEYMFCFAKGRPTKFNPIMVQCRHAGEVVVHRAFRNHGKDELEYKSRSKIKPTKVASNVFTYATGNGNTTAYHPAFQHPAVFPEALARDQIISWTDAGDTVLDPFCGSGTTIFCASVLGRKAIGIDISQEYVDLTAQRLREQPMPSWAAEMNKTSMEVDE